MENSMFSIWIWAKKQLFYQLFSGFRRENLMKFFKIQNVAQHWHATLEFQRKMSYFPLIFRLFSDCFPMELNEKIKKLHNRNFSSYFLSIFRIGISYIFLGNLFGIPVSFSFHSFLVVDEIWTFSASKCWVSSRRLQWATEPINK